MRLLRANWRPLSKLAALWVGAVTYLAIAPMGYPWLKHALLGGFVTLAILGSPLLLALYDGTLFQRLGRSVEHDVGEDCDARRVSTA